MKTDREIVEFVESLRTERKNSMKQANQNYQNWQDRQDVNKAFEDWAKKYFNPFFTAEMKAFALFFAERVKGAPLNSPEKPDSLSVHQQRKITAHELLNQSAKRHMIEWNQKDFTLTHPRLYASIIGAIMMALEGRPQ